METKPQFLPQQPLVVLIALLVWVLVGSATWLAAIISYVVALLAVNVILVWFPAALTFHAATTPQRRLFYAFATIAIIAAAGRLLAGLNPVQSLFTARENVADRWALERTPSIAPSLLVTYEPQRFFIHAPGCEKVRVRWGNNPAESTATNLGHGVFLLDFDPRSMPDLETVSGSQISCQLIADGTAHRRALNFVKPNAHPRQLDALPAVGIAVTVSEETDELMIVSRDGNCQRVNVGDGPTDCCLVDDGQRVVVAHRFTPELWIINVGDGSVHAKLDSAFWQTRLDVSSDGEWLAVANQGAQPGVRFFMLPELKEAVFLPLEFSPDLLEFAGPQLVVTNRQGRTVQRIDYEHENWRLHQPPLHFPRPITALGKMPQVGQLALATTASQLTSEQLTANHFVEDTIHTLDVANWKVVATQITDRRGLRQDSPGDTEHGVSPLGLAVIEQRLFAAFTGSNEVAAIAANGVAGNYFSFDSHSFFGPQGLGDLGAGCWCVTFPIDGCIGVFDRAGTLKTLIELNAAEDNETADPVALARRHGERTFHETTRAGIACQSCHLDAATDFCRHDIGQGKPVDVLTVRGLIGTSPYLRDASHWRLQELHEVAAVGYRDYPRPVNWDRASSLAAYLESLPLQPHPLAGEKLDVARLQAGVTAFFAADCATCHTPPAFTNLGQHSAVGLFPDFYGQQGKGAGSDDFLDTPSLRGVAQTAPYLHDGRAATLRAVLTEWNRTARHGNTRALSQEQLEDLLYLLERL